MTNVAFKEKYKYRQRQSPCKLTQGLYSFSLLAAGLATGLTADVVKSEEDVVFLMYVDWQLNFYLYTVENLLNNTWSAAKMLSELFNALLVPLKLYFTGKWIITWSSC